MLKEIIYKYFDDKRIFNELREKIIDKINFAPSYLSSCRRQIFYKKTNTPQSNPIEAHSYIKFEMGDSVHLSIQNILKNIGIYIEGEDFKEIEWQGLTWIYRIDGKIQVDKKDFIIELKSVYASGYNSIEKEAKSEHEIQLLMYMIFENIESGILTYIGRDNGFIVEYNYILSSLKEKYQYFLDNKIKELKQLKIDIESNNLPSRDFQITLKNNKGEITDSFQKDNMKYKSDWNCSYCSWKNLCWKEELEKIKDYNFYIRGEFT